MSRIVKVRNVKIGDGIPKICIPITDTDFDGVKKSVRLIENSPHDMVEWRADFYKDLADPEVRIKPMMYLRNSLPDDPILFTIRTSVEMGVLEIDTADYVTLNLAVIDSGLIDLVDVELSRGDKAVRTVVEAAHKAGVKVIVSRHNNINTPDRDVIVGNLCQMQDLGADIVKFAVTPRSERDVLRLLDATLAMKEDHNTTPVITMSMGKLGVISRICGEVFGSAVTFGTAGKASAPGQLPANQLSIYLKSLNRQKPKKTVKKRNIPRLHSLFSFLQMVDGLFKPF